MLPINAIRVFAAAAMAVAIACSARDELPTDRRDTTTTPAAPRTAAQPVPRPRIVVLGDSLTAGLGLAREEAYPALLQRRLNDEGLNYEVVNAGVSGDTSAGGLS